MKTLLTTLSRGITRLRLRMAAGDLAFMEARAPLALADQRARVRELATRLDRLEAGTCVVAPSLTPDSYNQGSPKPASSLAWRGFVFGVSGLEQHELAGRDRFFLKSRLPHQQGHGSVLLFRDGQHAH